MDEDRKVLAAKMAKVLGEVSRVPKSGRNTFQNYSYATEADALDAIRPLLAKHNIAVFFDCLAVEELDNNRCRVQCQIELVCGDSGASRSSIVYGEARDADKQGRTQDKGLYKAMTGAMKYWLFKTFLISTGDDPETDRGNEPSQSGAINRQRQSTGAVNGSAVISDAQKRRLFAIAKQKAWPTDEVKKTIFDVAGVDSSAKIPADKYDDVVAVLEGVDYNAIKSEEVVSEVA